MKSSGSSPIDSIFSQWIAQQYKNNSNLTSSSSSTKATSHNNNNYRILVQQSFSLPDRMAAAQPVNNEQVYQQAGQKTPAEVAMQDMLGGHAWLLHLFTLAATAVAKDAAKVAASRNNNLLCPPPTKLVLIATLPQGGKSMLQYLPPDLREQVQVLDLATHNPWGWDTEDALVDKTDEPNDSTTTERAFMHNLQSLYRHLRQYAQTTSEQHRNGKQQQQHPTIIIWQSIIPLIQYHGFDKVLQLLQALPGMQVWTTTAISCLSSSQHLAIEDQCHCLLQIHQGHATILKQGIREPSNLQRETISYNLLQAFVKRSSSSSSGYEIVPSSLYYQVVLGGGGGKDILSTDNNGEGLATEMGKLERGSAPSLTGMATSTTNANTTTTSTRRRRGNAAANTKVQLQLEEDDDHGRPKQQQLAFATAPATTRPQIYMDDDDPEFDDLDEEDPDDDLDI